MSIKRKNLLMGFALNTLVFAFEIIGLIISTQQSGLQQFQYYTQDSNIIAMFACGIMAASQFLCLFNKKTQIASWVVRFKYISVCLLTVTFLVVLFILAPLAGENGYQIMMLQGTMLFHHFLCPVFAFISFVLFENECEIRRKDIYFALIPTIIYAFVSILLNVLRVMTGPYPFLMVYNQPFYMSVIWFIVILGGAYVISWFIQSIKNRVIKKNLLNQAEKN